MNRDNLRVVLIESRNPLNIGAAARAMANFGFSRLRVVAPYDLAWREARSAVHGVAVLEAAERFDTVAQAVADCALVVGTVSIGNRALRHPLRRLETGAPLLQGASAQPVALLFGSEKYGLSNEDMAHCQWLMRIATDEHVPSMNLGQAVAVCLHELTRESGASGNVPKPKLKASAADEEQVTRMLLDALGRSGYVNPVTAASTEEKVRRLIRRMDLNAEDARVWMGMLRQILWKLGGV